MQKAWLSRLLDEAYNHVMDVSEELSEMMRTCDEPTRRRLGRYVRVREQLVELTGDTDVNEATPMIGRVYENHPQRKEIVQTAARLRAIGRLTFSRMKP